ncbi:MAG: glycosyltransferase involved in cell wall biosynthesis [Rubritalea sp.]
MDYTPSGFGVFFDAKIKEIVTRRRSVAHKRVATVANGVEAKWIVTKATSPQKIKKFICVGRYESRKGLPEINDAIQKLKNESCEFHFVGPLPSEIELDDSRVHYHGSISDPSELMELLSACDVLLCPSYAEGMPTVILEAMARGLAIIATDVGATSVMVNSANGILLDECSSDKIASALTALLHIPDEKLLSLKYESLNKVKQFSWNCIAKATLKLISQSLKNDR